MIKTLKIFKTKMFSDSLFFLACQLEAHAYGCSEAKLFNAVKTSKNFSRGRHLGLTNGKKVSMLY
jgi:hypothetical protein